jgi:hypothetical protein
VPSTAPVLDPVVPRELYKDVVARPLLTGRAATASAFRSLRGEHLPAAALAAGIRAEILPVLRQMLDGAQSVRLDDAGVLRVHQHAIDGARLEVAGFDTVAGGLERGDPDQVSRGSALLARSNTEWTQWASGVLTL